MDGYELAAQLRQRCPQLAANLIAITGHCAEREKALTAGFCRLLVKPISLDDLTVLVAGGGA
jgi:CheY-like chemotaxis protein